VTGLFFAAGGDLTPTAARAYNASPNPARRHPAMEVQQTGRTCPKCGSGDYVFRGRKKVPAEGGQGEAVETKYRCKACSHEWKVRVAQAG
jgi:DNA-directed RNA polymerase subunit M/transcription elongation factor TFIIS